MKTLILIFCLFPFAAQSAEAGYSVMYYIWKLSHPDTLLAASTGFWHCDPVLVNGPEVETCGIAVASDENAARVAAFEAAKAEFTKIYEMDDAFRGHAINVLPRRTECAQQEDGRFKCLRAVNFLLQHEMREKPIVSNDKFDTFVYEDTLAQPKLAKGMKKAEMLRLFGKPDSIRNVVGTLSFDYHGELCAIKSRSTLVSCTVFVSDGEVSGWDDHVDPAYTEDLK
jgi:hypothetical protein